MHPRARGGQAEERWTQRVASARAERALLLQMLGKGAPTEAGAA